MQPRYSSGKDRRAAKDHPESKLKKKEKWNDVRYECLKIYSCTLDNIVVECTQEMHLVEICR